MTNAVEVKFIKGRHLYPKSYTFNVEADQDAAAIKENQIVFVKNKKNKNVPVVVEKLLELPQDELKKHVPILPIRRITFYDPHKSLKSTKRNKSKSSPQTDASKTNTKKSHRRHLLRHVKIVLKKKSDK